MPKFFSSAGKGIKDGDGPQTFTLRGLDIVQRNTRLLAPHILKSIAVLLYQEGEAVMAKSKPLVPVDLGALRASGRVSPPVSTANSITVTLGYGGTASLYAVYVHEGIGPAVGRPPFMPPVGPFEDWAARHGMEGAGFLIARAVGQRGIKPTKYLERPFLEHARNMMKGGSFQTQLKARIESLQTEKVF
jgi:hypothetical protein